MSFVYCQNCDWQQDDFWSESYNPFNAGDLVDEFLTMLARSPSDRVQFFDIGFIRDQQFPCRPRSNGAYAVEYRELLARRFEQLAKRVRGMKWWTFEEFKSEQSPLCPVCRSPKLSID